VERNDSPSEAMIEASRIMQEANMEASFALMDQTRDYDGRKAAALAIKQAAQEKVDKLLQKNPLLDQ